MSTVNPVRIGLVLGAVIGLWHLSWSLLVALRWAQPFIEACYRIPSEAVDGMDVVAVEAAARRAIRAVRESGKPYFLECRTYRLRAHSMFDAQLYRDKAEVEAWRHREPIVRFKGWLEANGMIHPDDLAGIEAEVAAEIAEAVAFAEGGTWEPVEELTRFTYADRTA